MKYNIQNNFKVTESITSELLYGDLKKVESPFFSVVIPTYCRADCLKDAIMSAVNQKNFDQNYEIVVVDNEEGDYINESERMIRDLGISNLYYYKNKRNLGSAGNWNRGIMLARSNWIIMCHDDDWLKDDCLVVMKQVIEKHKNKKKTIGYVRSSAESWFDPLLYREEGMEKKYRIKKKRTAIIKQTYSNVVWDGGATWAGAPTCGTLLNKEAVLSVGGYNPELTPCFDCYVPYHMLGKYSIYKTYYPLGVYRWSENDTYKKETLLGLIKAYNEFLEILSDKHRIVRIFSNEHYADCVWYYLKKGKEAGVQISNAEITSIRVLKYSKLKLKILYVCRKINRGTKLVFAK